MLDSLLWQRALSSPDAKAQFQELQADTLRLLLMLTAVAYVVCHLATTLVWPTVQGTRQAYSIFPAAALVLAGSYLLLSRNQGAAKVLFVGGALLTVSWGLYVMENPRVATLYIVIALVTMLVTHPLGGFAVVGGAAGLLGFVGASQPGLIAAADIVYVVISAGLAVVAGWIAMHHLIQALNWYVLSLSEAELRRHEAEEHRAQVVQACKQLDTAYYRLERANDALQLAWKAADESERSKMEFTVNVSHELRTPLNLIIGYSEMMMTSPGSYDNVALPLPYRGDLYSIYCASQHLLELTDDILDMARMEAGHLGLLREPVDLCQLVWDASCLVRDYIEGKGLELRVELPSSGLPHMLLDRLRIRQVLLNLLTNAARFTERGWIEVQVIVQDEKARVGVTNTGSGIAEHDLSQIFQRFSTRDKPRPGWHAGTGLGLPISKQLIELHGGQMGVKSPFGGSTTFWFTLPLSHVSDTEPAPIAPKRFPAHITRHEQVIVLTHTEPGLARLLQRHLSGYRVEVADGLASAQARGLELRAAAILTDLDTPQSEDEGPITTVRCPLPHFGAVADGLGVASHLVKPISRQVLLEAIGNLDQPISRVLIADDDTDFVRLVSRMLGSSGCSYMISTAHNGEEAVAKMLADPPDLLLLDLTMPELDGVSVLRRMASESSLRSVTVIVVSAHDGGEGLVPLGHEVRIWKPEGFQLEELTRMLDTLISEMIPIRAHLDAKAPELPVA